ncbi:hypothetical protein Tco_0173029 [Tanacetum coccineum]
MSEIIALGGNTAGGGGSASGGAAAGGLGRGGAVVSVGKGAAGGVSGAAARGVGGGATGVTGARLIATRKNASGRVRGTGRGGPAGGTFKDWRVVLVEVATGGTFRGWAGGFGRGSASSGSNDDDHSMMETAAYLGFKKYVNCINRGMLVLWNPSVTRSVGILGVKYFDVFGFAVCSVTNKPTIIMISYARKVENFTLSPKRWTDIQCSMPRKSIELHEGSHAFIVYDPCSKQITNLVGMCGQMVHSSSALTRKHYLCLITQILIVRSPKTYLLLNGRIKEFGPLPISERLYERRFLLDLNVRLLRGIVSSFEFSSVEIEKRHSAIMWEVALGSRKSPKLLSLSILMVGNLIDTNDSGREFVWDSCKEVLVGPDLVEDYGFENEGVQKRTHCGSFGLYPLLNKKTKIKNIEVLLEAVLSLGVIRFLSDHRPILLRESAHDYGHVPFRFFHHWIHLEGFNDFVTSTWNSAPSVDSNGHALNLRKELNQLDAVIDKGTGTEVEAEKRMEVLALLHTLIIFHSMDLAQKRPRSNFQKIGDTSLVCSSVENPRGGIEQNQIDSLVELVRSCQYRTLRADRWELKESGESRYILVDSARRRIDEICLEIL